MDISQQPNRDSGDEAELKAMAARARVPLQIAMGMVWAVMVGAAIALGLPSLGALCGVVLLAIAFGLRSIERVELFRPAANLLYAITLGVVAWAVFGLELPSVITVYFPAMVLLAAAHLLGSRAALLWGIPCIGLVWAGVFLTPAIEQAVDPFVTFGVRSATLLTILGFAVSFRRTYDRQAKELTRFATTDPLTGLANRRELDRSLAATLGRSQRFGRHGAVVFVDLDGVKRINDRLGHTAGDELISCVAARIQQHTRLVDTAARLGGDEFVILLSEFDDAKGGELFARKLLQVLSAPADLGRERIQPSASIGVALFPEASADAEELLRLADDAMYHAKRAGGGRIYLRDAIGVHEAT